MKTYVCTNDLHLCYYDDDGFFVENKAIVIKAGKVFQRSEDSFRLIGALGTARLDHEDGTWLEITEEFLDEHFKEIKE